MRDYLDTKSFFKVSILCSYEGIGEPYEEGASQGI